MAAVTEKRTDARRVAETPIMFSCLDEHPYCYFGARKRNFNLGGISFESKYFIQSDRYIYVQEAYCSPQNRYQPYAPEMMRVVWCQKVNDEAASYYRIGATFSSARGTLKGIVPVTHFSTQSDWMERAIGITDTAKPSMDSHAVEMDPLEAIKIAQSSSRKLRILNQLALAIGSTLDLKELLKIICKEMVHIFGARNTGIGLLDAEKTKLKLVAFYTDSTDESDATGLELSLKANASSWYVVNTGQPIVVPDAQNNPITESVHAITRKRGTQCLMIVPLMTRGKAIGTIGMPTSDTQRIFTVDEVSLAQTIANQVASAIENARLFEETNKARKIAEHDLEIGRKIQTEFFPEKLPTFEGWEIRSHFKPARQVSGDFFDLFPLGDGHCLGIVMADVCDHGVGSALFMVLFRSLMRAYAKLSFNACEAAPEPSAEQIRTALRQTMLLTNNYVVSIHEKAGMFAPVFFGVLNPETGLLIYVNCGAEPPLILGPNGIQTTLKPTGPVVGLFMDPPITSRQIIIDSAQTLFAYTDGATDAVNRKGDPFLKERFFKLLTPSAPTAQSLLDRIGHTLAEYSSGVDQFDDITLLAIHRK